MEKYFVAVAGILMTVILSLTLRKQNGELALLLSICGCILAFGVAAVFLEPILAFLQNLRKITAIDSQMLGILLKVTGVAFLSEIAGTVCADAGNSALGKTLQMLAALVILYLSLPMMTALLELVEKILGSI